MHKLPWIAIFWSLMKRFANDFHSWRMTQKSLFTVTNVLFYFLHPILCSQHTNPLKHVSIAYFAIVAKDRIFWLSIVTSPHLICDVTQTWGTGIVTSYSSTVLACANLTKGDLHEWKTTVNINFSPPSINGLACKKIGLRTRGNSIVWFVT